MMHKMITLFSCLFVACVWWEDKTGGSDKELIFSILPQLTQNNSGYYILTVPSKSSALSHRVYAYIGARDYQTFEYEDLTQTPVNWHGNLYTVDGDTAGYYRKRRFVEDNWTYIRGDSLSVYKGDTTQFQPVITPITAISNDSGMVTTVLNISPQMFQDTMVLEAATLDQFDNCPLDSCYVGIPILFR